VVTYSEGLLSSKEKIEFEAQLSSDIKLQNELALIKKTKLIADAAIVFPDKESLKKEARVVVLFNYRTVAAIAAAILLLFGLVVIFRNNSGDNKIAPSMANKEKVQPVNNQKKENIVKNEKEISPETNNTFVANKSIPVSKKFVVKKDSSLTNKKEEVNIANNNQPLNDNKNNNPLEIKNSNDSALLVKNNSIPELNPAKTGVVRYTDLNALAITTDNEDKIPSPEKNSFWKRAVRFAKNINGLGLRAVKGEEKENENYSLSFNALNIEKK
jgi:hypothetical protein